jgi:Flp pilus assembly protein TadB
MKSPEDYDKDLQRIERLLQEKEKRMQVPQSNSENYSKNAKLYKTVKHQPENSGNLLQKKVILGLKLFGLAVATIVAVRIASIVAGIVIAGVLTFIAYKMFFHSEK